MRYLRLLRLCARASLQNDMAQKSNFFFHILSTVLSLAGGLAGVSILFSDGRRLAGWTFPQTMLVFGVYTLVTALSNLAVRPSLDSLGGMGGEIEQGTFDFTILRPVSKQFYASFKTWSVWSFADVLVGAAILIAAVSAMEEKPGLAEIGLFLLLLFSGLLILYSLLLLLCGLSFRYRGTYLSWILNDVLQTGRYPVGIYPGYLRMLLTWVVPIGFIVTVPAEALIGRATPLYALGGLLLAAAFLVLSRAAFYSCLKRYCGAGG